ncbi:MAG: ATP-binding protein [bacterium]|nr:ATP-binding protein [bacterium]
MQHPLTYLQREAKSEEWQQMVDPSLHDVVRASQLLIERDIEPARSISVSLYETGTQPHTFFGSFLLHKIASILHRYPDADKWLKVSAELLPDDDPISQAHYLSRLGMEHSRHGRLHESVEVHTRAQQAYSELGLKLEAALAQSDIGSALMIMGDAAGAVNTLLQAFPVIEREAPKTNANTLRANVASALQRSGNSDLARTMYLEALALPPFTRQGNARATVLHNLAIIEKEAGDIDAALRFYDMAMQTAVEADLAERRVRLAAGKAELLIRCNRTAEAITLTNAISEHELSVCTPMALFDVYAVRSRIHVAQQDYVASLHWFETAIDIARENSFHHERSMLLKEYIQLVPMSDESSLKLRLTAELADVLDHRLQEMSSSITKSVDMRMAYERSLRTIEAEREKEKTDVMLEAADQTTRAIANDLHDEVGQSVAVVGLALDRMLHGSDIGPLRPDLQFVRTQVETIGKTLRRLTHNLGAVMLENDGLSAAIVDLAASVRMAAPDLHIECSVIGDLSWLDLSRAKCLYRAAQNFVQNSIKHGKPSSIELQLVGSEEEALLSVVDDGVGFDRHTIRVGLGLRDVKLRIERLGGELDIDSTIGKGAFVSVRLPRL